MSDRHETQLDRLDERLREVEKVLFNGLTESSQKMNKWIDEKAPHLMTREEHARIDKDQAARLAIQNREIGKRKDRRLVALGLFVPLLTAGAIRLMDML